MKILALCGSLRPESATLKALQIAIRGVESAGGTCELLAGDDMDLPFYRELDEDPLPPKIERLKRLATAANGFLWGSPEYHGGCSGVLKNALDWLSSAELGAKPVALVAVAGGSMGAMNTLSGLRLCARHVNAWVLPEQVSIASSWDAFDEQGNLRDPTLQDRLLHLGRQLVATAKVLPQLR
jgi:FMN reductase